jgi:histidine phosphotransfer protein HptB
MTENAAIDASTFRALQDSAGADFVAELVGTFLEEAPRMMAELRQAFDGGDAERFRRTAHSLKSNGLTFGALAFAARAKTLELSGLDAVRAQGGDPLAGLAGEYARAAAELEALARA